jgi:chemotaxis protein MotB
MKREMIDASDPRVTLIGHPAPAWLVNYADLMTELVCFFIVLYALSASLNKGVQQAKKDVEEKMKQEQVQGQVKVDKDGMKITLEEKGDNVFFESGSSELSPRMKEILSKIAPPLKKLALDKHEIIVEGHTDDLPIRSTRFPSNWELSTARATSVVQYMINGMDFPPQRMGAIGYGQFQPIAPNDTNEHRSMNRRVVFFIKNTPPDFKKGDKSKAKGNAEDGKENPPAESKAPSTETVVEDANVSNPIPDANSQPADE